MSSEGPKVQLFEPKSDGSCKEKCVKPSDVQEKLDEGWQTEPCPNPGTVCEAGKTVMWKPKSDGTCEPKCVKDEDVQKKLDDGYSFSECENRCGVDSDGTPTVLMYKWKSSCRCEAKCVKADKVAEKLSKGYSLEPCSGPCNIIMCVTKSKGQEEVCVKAKDIHKELEDGGIIGPCDQSCSGSDGEGEGGEKRGVAATSAQSAKVAPVEMNMTAFPNPFKGTATVRFNVTATGTATLNVYDINGVQVGQLFNDNAEAGQEYEVSFDGSNNAAGVYFFRLSTGEQVMHQKLVMIK